MFMCFPSLPHVAVWMVVSGNRADMQLIYLLGLDLVMTFCCFLLLFISRNDEGLSVRSDLGVMFLCVVFPKTSSF